VLVSIFEGYTFLVLQHSRDSVLAAIRKLTGFMSEFDAVSLGLEALTPESKPAR